MSKVKKLKVKMLGTYFNGWLVEGREYLAEDDGYMIAIFGDNDLIWKTVGGAFFKKGIAKLVE